MQGPFRLIRDFGMSKTVYPFLLSPVLANEGFPVFISFRLDHIDDIKGFSFDEDEDEDEDCLLGPNGKFID